MIRLALPAYNEAQNIETLLREVCHTFAEVLPGRPFEIARGCAAMYYPEANILVPRTLDGASKTPAFKSVRVRVRAAEPVGVSSSP